MANKTINLTLRIDAKYKDRVDFLKAYRGSLTRLVESALDTVEVDYDLLKKMRELDELIVKKAKEINNKGA